MSGSHTLEKFINGVARDITDPQTKVSVWKRSQLRRIRDARTAEERRELRSRGDLRISALGSGSDYTTFLDHLGIASLNIGFGGEDGGGIYHSIYDDFYWYTKFSDTDFAYGRALAQTGGTAVMRLANADVLPFEFTNFADTLRRYVDELKMLHRNMQEEIRERNRQIDDGVFTATADPKEKSVPPAKEDVPPFINFAPLDNAVAALSAAAERAAADSRKASADLRSMNIALLQSERKLTHADGLPGRPWFKHMIYAPGFYTGYGVKTLPAVREAIEQKKWTEAEREIARTAKVLEQFAASIAMK
jgi:N-acetylated-alpha-linked acidic dipeptidase